MLILSILLLLFIVMGAASAADDKLANETVSTTTNDGVDTLNTDSASVDEKASTADKLGSSNANSILNAENDDYGNYSDLNKLIKGAEEGSTIKLDKNYKNETPDTTITISKSLTIDGDNQYELIGLKNLIIDANHVTFKNIKFTNQTTINWNGHYGTIENTIFNNILDQIIWKGDNGKLDTCDFTNLTNGNVLSVQTSNLDLIKVRAYNSSISTGSSLPLLWYPTNTGYGATFRNCDFFNITQSSTTMWFGLMRESGCKFYDCTFQSNSSLENGMVILAGVTEFYNCYFKFTNAKYLFGSDGKINVKLYNCTIDSSKQLFSLNTYTHIGAGAVLKDCKIINCTSNSWVVPIIEEGYLIDNVTFINCTGQSIVAVYPTGKRSQIINCKFINSTVTSNYGVVFINGENCIVENNTFINSISTFDNFNDTFVSADVKYVNVKNNTGTVNNYTAENFTVYSDIYVCMNSSDNGSDLGRKNNPCSLTYALNNVFYGGKIYIKPGIYNLTSNPTISSSIIGLGHVVINYGGFQMVTSDLHIDNIQFNQSTYFKNWDDVTSLIVLYNECYMNNCSFTNIKTSYNLISHTKYQTGTYLSNITVKNSKFANFYSMAIRESAGQQLDASTLENISIIKSNFTNFINNPKGAGVSGKMVNTKFVNITFNEAIFSNVFPNNIRKQFDHVTLNDFNFINSTLSNNVIYISNGNYVTIDNFTFDNISTVSGVVFQLCNGQYNSISNVTVKGTKMSNSLISIQNAGWSISDFNVENIKLNTDTVLISTDSSFDMNNFTVKNITAKSIFTSEGNSHIEKLTVTDSNIAGDVINLGYKDVLINSTFNNVNGSFIISGNSVRVNYCDFIGCNASRDGLIMVNGIHTRFNNCTFKDNYAKYGGACYINNNDTNFINCNFNNNTVSQRGGAIYSPTTIYLLIDPHSKTNLAEINVTDNDTLDTVKKDTVWIFKVLPTYNMIYLYQNATNQASSDGSSFHANDLETAFGLVSTGGTIYANATGELFNFTLTEELTKEGITVKGENTRVNLTNSIIIGIDATGLTLKGIIFENATNTAIMWYGADGKVINCTFKNNKNNQTGIAGAINVEGDNLEIINSTFINNAADGETDSIGGALYVNATGITITGSSFDNNMGADGSHIFVSDNGLISNITGSNFTNGKSPISSGGSGIQSEGMIKLIKDCNFKNNTAFDGGALYLNIIGSMTLDQNNFTHNTANSNGGAIYLNKGTLTFKGTNNFTNNTANSNGGAIYNNVAGLVVDGAVFNNNTAKSNGGAIYSSKKLIVSNAEFNSNKANNDGGALYLADKDNELNNVDFNDNTAVNGGAVYLASGKSMKLDTVSLSNNHNTTGYGVIYVGDHGSITIDGLTRDSSQSIYLANYTSDVLYVNPTKLNDGTGLTPDDAAALTGDLLTHLNDGGKVIFINKGTYNIDDVIEISKSIQFIGNTSTIKSNKNNKSLFNNSLTHIKSCS